MTYFSFIKYFTSYNIRTFFPL